MNRDAVRALDDHEVEVLLARAAPTDLARTPGLRWLQVPSAGVEHLADSAPWRDGLDGDERKGRVRRAHGGVHPAVAQHADALVIAAPLTDQTRGLVDRTVLDALPEGACLVNIARGPLVREADLIDALRAGRLSAAYLDVVDEEPLPAGHPLWDLPNVTVTPHVSGGDAAAWAALLDLFEENLRRYVAGEPLLNRVDPDRGY